MYPLVFIKNLPAAFIAYQFHACGAPWYAYLVLLFILQFPTNWYPKPW